MQEKMRWQRMKGLVIYNPTNRDRDKRSEELSGIPSLPVRMGDYHRLILSRRLVAKMIHRIIP
jgi:hypothetical protein